MSAHLPVHFFCYSLHCLYPTKLLKRSCCSKLLANNNSDDDDDDDGNDVSCNIITTFVYRHSVAGGSCVTTLRTNLLYVDVMNM